MWKMRGTPKNLNDMYNIIILFFLFYCSTILKYISYCPIEPMGLVYMRVVYATVFARGLRDVGPVSD